MRYLKFLIPLLLVACFDLLFQFGAWEPLASPESHAGMSISKKRALADPAFAHIDFVTLGSSRPVYGIDHEQFAAAAADRGYTYANLSVPGTHWMSLGVFIDWLTRHHPEIRGGVIALSVQDFLAPGNGTYELGITYPFRTLGEAGAMAQHVPFNWHDPATYGLYSGLFAYHEDVLDAVMHPQHRKELLHYFHALTPQNVLSGNADEKGNTCAAPVETLSDCAAIAAAGNAANTPIPAQCKQLQGAAKGRYDLQPYLDGQPLALPLRQARDLIRAQLHAVAWPAPPVVILMPMPSVWQTDVMPSGAHEWALSVLAPLVADGTIRLLDYTDIFKQRDTECAAFFDLYHTNVTGRARLMQQLLPELEHSLLESTTDKRNAAARAAGN
jgi:hypothetical protein